MRAKDVMTTKLTTVSPGNSVKRAAQTMLDCGVSGLPVVDDNAHLVGIISEGDLLSRTELDSGRFAAGDQGAAFAEQRARAYVKSHSWNVGDVMTPSVVAVDEDTPIGRVAALMEEHGIKRVPVTHEGKLVGIVSRRDLVRAIVAAKFSDVAPGDSAIRRSILVRLGENTGLEAARLSVSVANGVVHLWGIVGSEIERHAARVVAEGVSGVAGLVDHLRVVPGAYAQKEDRETDPYLPVDQ